MLDFYFKWQGIALVISAVAAFAWHTGHLGFLKFFLLFFVVNAVPLGIGKLIRVTTTYTVTSLRVSERKGILAKTSEQAPISRIENVTVRQSLSERMWGVGTVDFDTAGEKSGDILVWRGIANPNLVRSKIENVQSGDWDPDLDGDDPGPESPYFGPDPLVTQRGYIEDEQV